MAIRQYQENNKTLYEVYVHGHDAKGVRVQRKRRNIETQRKAETIEFELKRELALLKEQKTAIRWGEWIEECISIMKVHSRPSTIYSYEKMLSK